jgi:two-component system chemotaxis sensor kinase CheA
MDDLLRDFLTESNENLLKLDSDIVELERRPNESSLLNNIFRTIHTIKGTCGFLALTRLEAVAHGAESVLGYLREGKLTVSPQLISDVLAAIDVIKHILETLETTEKEPEGDDSAIIATLEHWLNGEGGARNASTASAPTSAPAAAAALSDAASIVSSATPIADEVVVNQPDTGTSSNPTPNSNGDGEAPTEGKSAVVESTLRVNVMLLDKLMNLVGELVLGRNQLTQLAAADDESVFAAPVQHLNRVTTDLQEAVMKTRMQAIGNAWTKLPRLVRDLSQANGKRIELELHGAETELDRQILQAIQDPLTHMVRNSADHGIETPDARRSAGKTERGTIRLNAYHEGGHVILEISDDGAGINVDRVRQKAVERGLVKGEVAASLPDSQVLRFIFEPGFSTAEKITNVSGRGVGMDVVRSNIEKIGGTVDLSSQVGRGTTVRIKIPLTLAIISALLVGAGNEAFAIPQIGVVELVRVTAEQRKLIEDVHGAQFYRLRDTLLPLVHLHRVFGLEEGEAQADYNIVVCQVGDTRFGLAVAEVFDTQEIVVKPVGRLVKHLNVYAGCTILGDGRVIMILDTTGIASIARVSSAEEAGGARQSNGSADEQNWEEGELESVVLFDAGYPALQAVPLSLVARLEEIPLDQMEEVDGRFLVQYRGSLLPIVPANPSVDVTAKNPRPVIVFSDGERSMGLAVNEIRDIVEDRIRLQRAATRPGVTGVCVIGGRATEVIDTNYFLCQAHGDWFGKRARGANSSGEGHVLLVDDSKFFLNLLAPMLRAAGYRVTTALDGKDALSRLERSETFDLILSDIEMINMDGFELARQVRANPQWRDVTLVALTSRASVEDRAKGVAVGFDHYLAKFDREEVLATLNAALSGERVAA